MTVEVDSASGSLVKSQLQMLMTSVVLGQLHNHYKLQRKRVGIILAIFWAIVKIKIFIYKMFSSMPD